MDSERELMRLHIATLFTLDRGRLVRVNESTGAPAFRGRGYASIATAAWLDAIRRSGLVPLYSTSWQNTASRALARRLGLTQFGADLHFT